MQKTRGAEQESLYTLKALVGRLSAQPMRDRQARDRVRGPIADRVDA
jgi:hypothetical protein